MEMPQLRKSEIGGLRHLFLDGFPQAVWKRPSPFPHSHRPVGGFTQREIGEFRGCGFLLKPDSRLTEAIHFGNDVHRPASHRLTAWMLCVGTLDAFRSESLVGFVGIRILPLFIGTALLVAVIAGLAAQNEVFSLRKTR